jgi:putative transport protein
MDFIIHGLRSNPELAIFLTLAVGFLIGRMKFGSFSLGIVVGTLLAGVVIGQLDIKVSPLVKTVFFDLFLFTTGYKVGPQFFRGLSRDAIPQVALTVVLCVTCLACALVFSKVLGYDIGTAAGLLAGAFSELAEGTAGEATAGHATGCREDSFEQYSGRLCRDLPDWHGKPGLVLPTIGPKLMRINLREEGCGCRPRWSEAPKWRPAWSRRTNLRCPHLSRDEPGVVDKTVAQLEALPERFRVSILRSAMTAYRRGTPDSVVRQGDVVAILARKEAHLAGADDVGPEVDDKALIDVPLEVLDDGHEPR